MHTWTNMAAPDDPYRTGQQLYRRPCPMLAAFTVAPPADASHPTPAAIGIVYLPLHRTQMLAITEETLTFGFRAAGATCAAETPLLAAVADVDLLQARRHAAVLAGHRLPADLHLLRKHTAATATRGLAAVEGVWAERHTHRRGTATMIDSAEDLPAPGDLVERKPIRGHRSCRRLFAATADGHGVDRRPDGGTCSGHRPGLRPAPAAVPMARNGGHPPHDARERMGLLPPPHLNRLNC